MGLQAKKHRPQEVPIKSSARRGKPLGSTWGSPIFPHVRGGADTLGWRHGPSHGERAASVVASGTGACNGGGQKPDRSFFSTGNAPRRRQRYPKWLLARVYSLPESELIQRQLVYAIG